MCALLFFDIDGTLITLDDSHTFPESTKQALLKAKDKGHKIFINTGRVRTAVDKQLKNFPFDGMVCGCGTYIEYEGQSLYHASLKQEDCVTYARRLHECGVETVFEGKNQLYVDGNHGKGEFLEFIFDYFSKNSEMPIGNYLDADIQYDKFTTYLRPGCNEKLFYETFETDFHLIPHGGQVIEAVPRHTSKATGIHFLEEYLKCSHENSYAFGDSINDMEMLRYVPHSIGMGNAVSQVKDVVEFVTEDVTADGIAVAMKHYNLI